MVLSENQKQSIRWNAFKSVHTWGIMLSRRFERTFAGRRRNMNRYRNDGGRRYKRIRSRNRRSVMNNSSFRRRRRRRGRSCSVGVASMMMIQMMIIRIRISPGLLAERRRRICCASGSGSSSSSSSRRSNLRLHSQSLDVSEEKEESWWLIHWFIHLHVLLRLFVFLYNCVSWFSDLSHSYIVGPWL